MRNAANKGGRMRELKKWRERLERLVMCTGGGATTDPAGGPGIGRRRRIRVPDDIVRAALEGRLLRVNMWSSHGVVTSSGLHFDHYENHLLVLSGVKRALIFPPSQTKYLYRANEGTHCKVKAPSLNSNKRKKRDMAMQFGNIREHLESHRGPEEFVADYGL